MHRSRVSLVAAICAVACFCVAVQLTSNDAGKTAEEFRRRGIALYSRSEFHRAVADMTRALEIDSSDDEARVYRSLALLRLGHFVQAMNDANELVAGAPKNPNHFWLRGRVRSNSGDYKHAVNDYSDAIRLEPRCARAFSERAIAHFELGHHRAALLDLAAAIQIEPENSELYKTRAFFHVAAGELDAALDDWNSVVKLCPKAAYALSKRAWVHAARGEFDKADADYAAAVAINPQEAGERYPRNLAEPAATVRRDQEPPISPENVLAEFDLAKSRGNVIIVPVTIGDQTFKFWLDTGCTSTIFDQSLRPLLGPQLGSSSFDAQQRPIRVRLYAPPKLSLGPLIVDRTTPVLCMDLALIRSLSGEPLDGILGLDVLSQFVLRLDVSGRKVCFLRSAEDACGERITMIQAKEPPSSFAKKYGDIYQTVAVSACLAEAKSALFMLDTGAVHETVMVKSELSKELSERKAIDKPHKSFALTASGVYAPTSGVLTSITVGDFRHQQLSVKNNRREQLARSRLFSKVRGDLRFPKSSTLPRAVVVLCGLGSKAALDV